MERLDDGEVSPYLTDELRAGDDLELRGPIGGYFVWEPEDGGPVLLLAGGSGVVPLRSILRHRGRTGSTVPVRLLYSSRTLDDVRPWCRPGYPPERVKTERSGATGGT